MRRTASGAGNRTKLSMDIRTKRYDFVIAGSGAGGSALARALARNGRRVLVIEKGRREKRPVSLRYASGLFSPPRRSIAPLKSKEGVIVWQAFMAGGSTVVSWGDAVRCLERELDSLGIPLAEELREAEGEIGSAPLSDSLMSSGGKAIRRAAEKLGYPMEPAAKCIDPAKCRMCGGCSLGCPHGAQWSALAYLDDALSHEAHVLFDAAVTSLTHKGGTVTGIEGRGPLGKFEVHANTVILAAGGLATASLLRRCGIEKAGGNLFVNMFVNTFGRTQGLHQADEPPLSLLTVDLYKSEGIILAPYVSRPRAVRYAEQGLSGLRRSPQNMLGIRTKIADVPTGSVLRNGSFSKAATAADRKKLDRGLALSREILIEAGADPESITATGVQGAHPGGTAPVGAVVNSSLETEIKNLYICDASLLPAAPVTAPTVTLAALGKRLAKTLLAKH